MVRISSAPSLICANGLIPSSLLAAAGSKVQAVAPSSPSPSDSSSVSSRKRSAEWMMMNHQHQLQGPASRRVADEFLMTDTASEDEDSCYSDASSIDSDWDEYTLDIEERVNSLSAMGSTPAFAGAVFDSTKSVNSSSSNSSSKRHKNNNNDSFSVSSDVRHARGAGQKQHRLVAQQTTSVMAQVNAMFSMTRSASADLVVMQSSMYTAGTAGASKSSKKKPQQQEEDIMKPDDCLHEILRESLFGDATTKKEIKLYPASELKSRGDFFLEMTQDNVAAYDMTIATAVRNDNMDVLRQYHKDGKNLQCCNRFHESIIHTVCRRGHTKLLQYLLDKTDVSIQIVCDYGRTVLHDACWTHTPNFDLMKLILARCPDLLLITDQRGFTPLQYVGRQHWNSWCDFLKENKDLVRPKILV